MSYPQTDHHPETTRDKPMFSDALSIKAVALDKHLSKTIPSSLERHQEVHFGLLFGKHCPPSELYPVIEYISLHKFCEPISLHHYLVATILYYNI
jgi:hypothetical protein